MPKIKKQTLRQVSANAADRALEPVRTLGSRNFKFVRDAIDRGNMQVASLAKNIIAEYGVEPEEIRNAAISAYAHSSRFRLSAV